MQRYLVLLVGAVVGAPDLEFARVSPGPDSSAQFRSAVLPRIFGGQEVRTPLVVTGPYGARQKYYKPRNRTVSNSNPSEQQADCPTSPFITYLSKSQQEELFKLVRNARSQNADETSVKSLMIDFMRQTLDSTKFSQFEAENREFEKQVIVRPVAPGRGKRATDVRRIIKRRPERHVVRNQREVYDIEEGARITNEIPLHRLPVV
ncbi:unnamed protein product [Bursaphelenchus xylophilus]|uniref:(pine wood nematode) hypothetical protein n=1 Tax=Bursaphelenchus xylophilus TaxID=6326 RepID=A0A1I7S2I6_BURXY|nr:unnamed protein product [Bursaphelenchus xylophilus]CAG9121930.1 unnamed protein product [Bursaphelenchus xylophilus]